MARRRSGPRSCAARIRRKPGGAAAAAPGPVWSPAPRPARRCGVEAARVARYSAPVHATYAWPPRVIPRLPFRLIEYPVPLAAHHGGLFPARRGGPAPRQQRPRRRPGRRLARPEHRARHLPGMCGRCKSRAPRSRPRPTVVGLAAIRPMPRAAAPLRRTDETAPHRDESRSERHRSDQDDDPAPPTSWPANPRPHRLVNSSARRRVRLLITQPFTLTARGSARCAGGGRTARESRPCTAAR